MLITALDQPDHEQVQFVLGKGDIGLQRLVVPMIDIDRHIMAVAGDILDIRILHQRIDLTVAEKVAVDIVLDLAPGERFQLEIIIVDHRLGRLREECLLILIELIRTDRDHPEKDVLDVLERLLLILVQLRFEHPIMKTPCLLIAHDPDMDTFITHRICGNLGNMRLFDGLDGDQR